MSSRCRFGGPMQLALPLGLESRVLFTLARCEALPAGELVGERKHRETVAWASRVLRSHLGRDALGRRVLDEPSARAWLRYVCALVDGV